MGEWGGMIHTLKIPDVLGARSRHTVWGVSRSKNQAGLRCLHRTHKRAILLQLLSKE